MMCYVCHTEHPLTGSLIREEPEVVAICHHCGAGVCAEHAHRAQAPGSPIYCEECFAVVNPKASRRAGIGAVTA